MTVRVPLVRISGKIVELPTADVISGAAPGIQGDQGVTGQAGVAASISVGDVTTLAYTATATVSNSGSSSAAVFDFGIPQGAPGTDGNDGVGVPAGGSANNVLTKASGTDYDTTWQAPSSAGALVLLEQHTASASTSLDFTAWYSSTYDDYEIHVVTLVPASASQTVTLRFSTDGGSSYDSGNNYGWSTLESSSSGSGVGGNQTTSGIGLMRNLTTTANYSSSGRYTLYNPARSGYKDISGVGSVHTGTGAESQTATGVYRSASAVNAFRILMGSGNIASGIIRVYGIAKS